MKTVNVLAFLLVMSQQLWSQSISEYTLRFEPETIAEFAGVQSFSWAKSGDDLLIIGGRLDGLHRRQPWASFDSAGHNDQLIVINLKSLQVWKRKLNQIEIGLYSQLKATNHCFAQHNDTMMIVGGYGIDELTKEHTTFNSAIQFSVSKVIDGIKNQVPSHVLFKEFATINDERFAVTGGQLVYLDKYYYIVGGHNFQGRYNPNDMPSFTQKYTNAVHRFQWAIFPDNSSHKGVNEPKITEVVLYFSQTVKDSLLHKRDFNLVRVQHVPDTSYMVALSGVFQYDQNLPFQNAVQITPELKLREYPDFRQFYNQYECADFSVFDEQSKTTSTFLIGGISNFYDSLGVLVQNDDVPFVPTLSRLFFAPDGTILEYLLPNRLPKLMGAGAAFIPNSDARWDDGLFNWKDAGDEDIFVGWMLGGIIANQPSTFWYTEGEASKASNGFYKVYLQKTSELSRLNSASKHPLNVHCNLNTKKGVYDIELTPTKAIDVTIVVRNAKQEMVSTKTISLDAKRHTLKKLIPKKPGMYFIDIQVANIPHWAWKQYLVVE